MQNKSLPYLCQHRLRQTGQHEDLNDLSSVYEAIVVNVCFLKEFVVTFPVSRGHDPVHCWLESTKGLHVFRR